MLGDLLAQREGTQHLAAKYYGRIVQDYPLSSYVPDAKAMLTKLGAPIPQPSSEALARMQKEKELGKQRASLARRTLGMFRTGPDVTSAARAGPPNLEPPSEAMGGETLRAGLGMSVSGGVASGGAAAGGSAPTAPAAPSGSTGVNVENTSGTADSKPASAEASKPMDPKEAKKLAEKKKKEEEKKEKESSSKKKKGLRKLIPW
jgi:hypothetical protein